MKLVYSKMKKKCEASEDCGKMKLFSYNQFSDRKAVGFISHKIKYICFVGVAVVATTKLVV